MPDFYEIDFLEVSPKSGDAITLRYALNGEKFIHVVDAGFQKDGEMVVNHIDKYYDRPDFINHVVATHNDQDHCGGLQTVLDNYDIGTLWIFRPWVHAEKLLRYFPRYQSAKSLATKLRKVYSNLVNLEEIALSNDIRICEPFGGKEIGAFKVLSPSPKLFFEMLIESEKTPKQIKVVKDDPIDKAIRGLYNWQENWGYEYFPEEGTSCDNEMSVVQRANIEGIDIILTGDAGRNALRNVIKNSQVVGLKLPLERGSIIQVPHHGSRRNVDENVLDGLLGSKSPNRLFQSNMTKTAIVSASGMDEEHPKKAVVRGFMHRGAEVLTTGNCGWLGISSAYAPLRENSYFAYPEPYPTTQEID